MSEKVIQLGRLAGKAADAIVFLHSAKFAPGACLALDGGTTVI
ncbi:hypothetical protein [Rhodococcus sp. NPDC057529]